MASIKLAGDTSGEVTISAPAVAGTTTLTLPATSSTLATQNALGVRNLIINGDMRIDQRNSGSAWGTSINGFCVDRWACYQSVTGKINGGQNYNSITPPTGYTNYIGVQSQSAYSVLTGDYYVFRQPIEGYNIANLSWGTANAKTVTLSFLVRSSLTGTFGGSISNGSVSYPFTYTISSADTWEQKTVTIDGPSTGTWGSSNALGLYVYLGFGVGSTYSGTAGAWGAGNYYTATGATSVVGTSSATFYITGVQLEADTDTATPFEHRPYDMEFSRCMRYYERGHSKLYMPPATGGFTLHTPYKVTKRASASVTVTSGTIGGTESLTATDFGSYYNGNTTQDFNWAASAEL